MLLNDAEVELLRYLLHTHLSGLDGRTSLAKQVEGLRERLPQAPGGLSAPSALLTPTEARVAVQGLLFHEVQQTEVHQVWTPAERKACLRAIEKLSSLFEDG